MTVPSHFASIDLAHRIQPQPDAALRAAPDHAVRQPADSKLQHAAKEFEAVFLRQMLTALERTTKVGSSGASVAGQQTYGTMVVEAVADAVASAGGLGLARTISSALAERVDPNSGLQGTLAPSEPGRHAVPEKGASQPPVGSTSTEFAQGFSLSAVPTTEIRTTNPTSPGQVADRRIR